MASEHHESDPSVDQDHGWAKLAAHVWQVPFLRNIFIVCLTVALLFPLYNWIYLAPAYRHQLAIQKETSAKQVAAHLMRKLHIGDQMLSARTADPVFKTMIFELKSDFQLQKFNLFDARGLVVYSTDAAEIGQVNAHPYFTQKVAKGRIHSNVVVRGERTAEDQPATRDVVEIYIPVLKGPSFLGAFEIYYDITRTWAALDGLLLRSGLTVIFIAVSLMVIVGIILFKASGAMLAHTRMDQALGRARADLEKRVQERTLELIQANKELQFENFERRQAEEDLRESEKRYRTLIETIPHGIREIDTLGKITFVNPAHAVKYGYEPDELMNKTVFDLAAGEDEARQLQEHLEYLVQAQPHPNPWFSKDRTRDGRTIETQVDWNYKRSAQGKVVGLISVISDITHRKQAEKALLDNLKFMNTLIDTIPNPVFYKDADGVFLGCNVAYAQTLGRSKEEILGRRLIDFENLSFSDMVEHFHHQDLALIHKPGIQTHEEQLRCADGLKRDFMMFKATFRDAEGEVAGLVGIMLDISDRKKVEKELKASKNLFDAFMRHMPGPAVMKDAQGRYLFVNDAFFQFTDLPTGPPYGLRADQVWDAQTAAQLRANDQQVLQSQAAANHMETVRLPSGQERHLLTTRFPIFQDESLYALGAISIDITERTLAEQKRQQLELQLQQAQKMEALGTLAGGIAHDFNNILAAIIGYTEIVAADIEQQSQNRHYLVRVLEAGERARALVKQILAFSRQSEMEPQPVQLKIIVKEVLKLLRASLPVTIEMVQNIQSDATIMADPVQIHQVMMNLCTNAGYAMRAKGGRLSVSLEEIEVDQPFRDRHGDLKPGSYLRLSVTDTGTGIAPEHMNRIFDPFFTTKPKGEGTGMGLAVVHGIVARLNGVVTVQSTPGQGARFDIYLPIVQSEKVLPTARSEVLPTGKERLLLVDDEVFQTDMLKHMLGLLGYKVETRNRGADALDLFEKDPQAFDLVITDMIMPEMTGDVLAQHMLELRADLPIILCTGYSENITESRAKELGIKAFALKPLVMKDLAHLIRQVLDREID